MWRSGPDAGRIRNVPRPRSVASIAEREEQEISAGTPEFLAQNPRWGKEASVLLAQDKIETEQLRVELPPHISASRLVALGKTR
ncbi:hypothetical protein [Arthrobacter psychrolactophilus]